ncbi:acyl-CoA thioester hydrolase/BAAT C-terminal domain-containing protein [Allosphingosinicella deserti]|nr:acyl-CoA thioester hydrolase/BAAT C-terminal domain-containing protein [Sphingomonas deserti]
MKRRWKIAIGVVLFLVVAAGGLFAWNLLKPAKPAEIVDAGTTGRRIDEGGLFANYFTAGQARRPGILLLGGSEGGLGKDLKLQALLLQKAGYNVLHLGYFNVPGKHSKLERVPLEHFYRGLDWLKARPEVDGTALAIVGYSKGAEAALLVATRYPGVRAVVAGMPSNVVWDGLSGPAILFGGISSWSQGGTPVPSLAYGSGDGSKDLLPVFVNALAELGKHPETEIPVERFAGRLLMVCGERDLLWPSCPMGRAVEARARKAGRPAVQLLTYPEAGHAVMGAPLPPEHKTMRHWATIGGTAQANAAARADSWPKVVAFLDATLANPPAP